MATSIQDPLLVEFLKIYPRTDPNKPGINLKNLLKWKFPGVVFSVRLAPKSQGFWTFIDVRWTTPIPTDKDVYAISEKFLLGGYDDTTPGDSLYIFKRNKEWADHVGGVNFIHLEHETRPIDYED